MLDDGELIKYENHYQDYHEVDSLYTNPSAQTVLSYGKNTADFRRWEYDEQTAAGEWKAFYVGAFWGDRATSYDVWASEWFSNL